MPSAPPPLNPACKLPEVLVRCLEELERGGAPAVAAVLAAHPDLAPSLLARLMLLGDLGLLPEAGPPTAAAS